MLADCERASPYVSAATPAAADDAPCIVERTYGADTDIVVISDLHMASGRRADGNYEGTENFFADDALVRFVRNTRENLRSRRKKGVLVVNGDFVDLLRVVRVPAEPEELSAWKEVLDAIGLVNVRTDAPFTIDELRDSIDKREEKFGLKTNDYKSIWKLATVVEGHLPVFEGLAAWLNEGNELIITKGNHDLEWLWRGVRDYLRLVLWQLMIAADPAGKASIAGKILFIDDALLINKHLYIEHGQRYDPWTRVIGSPTLGKSSDRELNIPMGSFMNRYLINQMEEIYPFFDNIRPQEDILPVLMREHFGLGMSILFRSIPMALRLIPKRYFRFFLRRVLPMLLGIVIPLVTLAIVFYRPIVDWVTSAKPFFDSIPLSGTIISSVVPGVLMYFVSKIIASMQISEPGSLRTQAFGIGMGSDEYDVIVMGHTHNPEQFTFSRGGGKGFRYFNTGTWIPVVETSSVDIREDKTYTYLHFTPSPGPGGNTTFSAPALERWDDEAGRGEPLRLVATP